MKVLITGANGKLASHVIRALEAAHELVLFARRQPAAEFSRHPWIQGDVTDFPRCQQAMTGIDAVQHFAAQTWPTDHPRLRADAVEQGLPFDTTIKTNILGTYYVMQAAVEAGVKTVVMAGSIAALGIGFRLSKTAFPFDRLPIDETHPCVAEDSYSFSKKAGEELLATFSRGHGIRTYVTRIAGICPPERRAEIAQARKTTGWNEWMFSWAASEDIAQAHRLLMEQAGTLPMHDVFFVNADDTTCREPTMDLIERFRPDLLSKVTQLSGHQSLISSGKLQKALGWVHETTWRDLPVKSRWSFLRPR